MASGRLAYGDRTAGFPVGPITLLDEVGLDVRETKSMGAMLIVTNLTTVKNQHGRVVATQRSQGLFY